MEEDIFDVNVTKGNLELFIEKYQFTHLVMQTNMVNTFRSLQKTPINKVLESGYMAIF